MVAVRVLYFLANALAAVVIVLVLIKPTRDLVPIFVLLVAAVACAGLAAYLNVIRNRRKEENDSRQVPRGPPRWLIDVNDRRDRPDRAEGP
jgi:hypothetical protein